MININIEIHKRNKFKEILQKIHNHLENFLFSIIQKTPEKFIPTLLMNWMEHYTNKRLSELKQQVIRTNWKNTELKKTVDNIHTRQQS